jgi:predicted nucleic acid binding AN1-type Zn finger protein
VRNLIEEAGKRQDHPTPRLVGRPNADAKDVLRLEDRHHKQWPAKSSNQLCCHLSSSRGQRKGTAYKCARCDEGLCMVPCFKEYHTKVVL